MALGAAAGFINFVQDPVYPNWGLAVSQRNRLRKAFRVCDRRDAPGPQAPIGNESIGARRQRRGLWPDIQMEAGQYRRRIVDHEPDRDAPDPYPDRDSNPNVVLPKPAGLPNVSLR